MSHFMSHRSRNEYEAVYRNLRAVRELTGEARSHLVAPRVSLWWRLARWVLGLK